jgi:hypothetical protein
MYGNELLCMNSYADVLSRFLQPGAPNVDIIQQYFDGGDYPKDKCVLFIVCMRLQNIHRNADEKVIPVIHVSAPNIKQEHFTVPKINEQKFSPSVKEASLLFLPERGTSQVNEPIVVPSDPDYSPTCNCNSSAVAEIGGLLFCAVVVIVLGVTGVIDLSSFSGWYF